MQELRDGGPGPLLQGREHARPSKTRLKGSTTLKDTCAMADRILRAWMRCGMLLKRRFRIAMVGLLLRKGRASQKALSYSFFWMIFRRVAPELVGRYLSTSRWLPRENLAIRHKAVAVVGADHQIVVGMRTTLCWMRFAGAGRRWWQHRTASAMDWDWTSLRRPVMSWRRGCAKIASC